MIQLVKAEAPVDKNRRTSRVTRDELSRARQTYCQKLVITVYSLPAAHADMAAGAGLVRKHSASSLLSH